MGGEGRKENANSFAFLTRSGSALQGATRPEANPPASH
jgi:hypothetical protein